MLARLLLCALAALPLTARAELRLLDEPLRLAVTAPSAAVSLAVVAAEPPAGGMDWDILGEPKEKPPPSDAPAMRRRRWMMKTHQAVGLGLVALQIATTTVGQLNYGDKFASGPNTNRYRELHAALAYTNLGVFAINGAIALLAPEPPGLKRSGFDRVTLHKVSMLTAALGMAAQGVLGVYTSRREGFQNQERIGQVHLALGYATFAALMVGAGAIVL